MSRLTRKTILALAAIASLGTFALASTDASARVGPGGGGHSGAIMHVGGGHAGRFTQLGRIHRPGINIGHRPGIIIGHHPRPHFGCYRGNWRWCYGWRRPVYIAPVVATAVATGVVTSTWNRCNCLTKEYTQEGAVVFKDLCTQEMAMNPPLTTGPAAYDPAAPQQPMVQGSLQPQLQPQLQPVPQVR